MKAFNARKDRDLRIFRDLQVKHPDVGVSLHEFAQERGCRPSMVTYIFREFELYGWIHPRVKGAWRGARMTEAGFREAENPTEVTDMGPRDRVARGWRGEQGGDR